MVFSLAACGNSASQEPAASDSSVSDAGSPLSSTQDSHEDTITESELTGPETSEPEIIDPAAQAGTMGQALWNAFRQTLSETPETSMEELANTLVANPVIQFTGMTAPVEVDAEYFSGFGEYRITGYESAATFAPMIGSIAFIGYVFDLHEDTDVSEFIKGLTDHCDPRWNICVEADQTVAGAVGDRVLFVMCPANAE